MSTFRNVSILFLAIPCSTLVPNVRFCSTCSRMDFFSYSIIVYTSSKSHVQTFYDPVSDFHLHTFLFRASQTMWPL